jgi:hypothetical protein
MDRRKFLVHAGLISTALTSGATSHGASEKPAPAPRVGRHGELTLRNDALAWQLEWHEGRLSSARFDNKLSGHTFPLSEVRELTLTFSASKHRVEIPW